MEYKLYHEVFPGNNADPKTLEPTISVLKDRFHIGNFIFIADRAFGRSGSLDIMDQNRYITAAYRWDQPYRNSLMETDFTDGQNIDDLSIKRVNISVDGVTQGTSTGEQIKLAGKSRYIAVYNSKMEKLDLNDLNDNLYCKEENIRNPCSDRIEEIASKLKSLVKFSESGAI